MAFPSYMKVQGTRQGEFKGNSANPARSGWIDCLDLLERISFVFQTITLTYSDRTSASDSWSDRT
jgi:hypothetical protein